MRNSWLKSSPLNIFCWRLRQGCQMVYFQTKNPNLGKFCRALHWKMLIHFMAIGNIWQTFGIFYHHLLHFVFIWYSFPLLVSYTKKNLATLVFGLKPRKKQCSHKVGRMYNRGFNFCEHKRPPTRAGNVWSLFERKKGGKRTFWHKVSTSVLIQNYLHGYWQSFPCAGTCQKMTSSAHRNLRTRRRMSSQQKWTISL
jgi:hypothetical protein